LYYKSCNFLFFVFFLLQLTASSVITTSFISFFCFQKKKNFGGNFPTGSMFFIYIFFAMHKSHQRHSLSTLYSFHRQFGVQQQQQYLFVGRHQVVRRVVRTLLFWRDSSGDGRGRQEQQQQPTADPSSEVGAPPPAQPRYNDHAALAPAGNSPSQLLQTQLAQRPAHLLSYFMTLDF
jgi:hypothetical protein